MSGEDLGRAWVEAMRREDWTRAWAISAAVLAARDPAARDNPRLPYHQRWVWDGRPFDGRNVLVRCYHGLGDTIQYARYLPELKARAASLMVEAQPSLCGLLAAMGCIDRLIPFDPANPAPPSACDLEITELPFALRAPPDRVPPPYLHAAPAMLPPGTVGLCYSAGDWEPARSVPPPLLAPLAERWPVVTLVAEPTGLPVRNSEGCPFDMDATAALIAGCDLVISVDTMVAHLAGALGKPVWLLLKAEPDWRWTPGERATPWYPAMRLYHQPAAGDWATVIAEVARDLAARYGEAPTPRECP